MFVSAFSHLHKTSWHHVSTEKKKNHAENFQSLASFHLQHGTTAPSKTLFRLNHENGIKTRLPHIMYKANDFSMEKLSCITYDTNIKEVKVFW